MILDVATRKARGGHLEIESESVNRYSSLQGGNCYMYGKIKLLSPSFVIVIFLQ